MVVKGGIDVRMRGFEPADFIDYHAYETNRNQLERAQRTAKSVFDIWNAGVGLFLKDSGYYYEILSLLDDAVQIGYERAIGLSHKSTDYDIDAVTLNGYTGACNFCKHQYFVYGCEEECARKSAGLSCEIDAKEYLD